MRTLAIGDIHGCSRALATLLAAVAPTSRDRIVALGDYVDRGPDSRGVLEQLLSLHATGRLVALRGNHELMMLDARNGGGSMSMWLMCGGDETLASYGAAAFKNVPEAHWAFLDEACVDWHEEERHFFVHANAYPDWPLNEQPEDVLFWERVAGPCAHVSGKIMVCGHTPQRDRLPLNLGTTICIDTAAYEPDGWLTCLDVGSGKYWQANEDGKVRSAWLEEK